MSNPPTRSAYVGTKPLLVIAIDVGTTFSGASYTFLRPKQVPKIYNVSRYEGQEDISGCTRVPSVLYYDSDGTLLSCGPQANNQAATEGGIRAEWFRLLLRPSSSDSAPKDARWNRIRTPPGTSAIQIFGDFLNYMRSCVQRDMCDRFVEGEESWESMHGSARYILSHPNEWTEVQHGYMREAAIKGRLVSDTPEGRERINFVTEGEATFHWFVDMKLAQAALSLDSRIIVVDAGRRTIDVSSFHITSLRPLQLQLQEAKAPKREFEGSEFVTQRFKNAIRGSQFGDEEHIKDLVEDFDKSTGRLFRNAQKPTYMKIGSRRYNDPEYGIRSGQLMVSGEMIAAVFEPSCNAAAKAIRDQSDGHCNTHVFLAGSFGLSPWLYGELQRLLSDVIRNLKNDNSNSGKAVAHGAVARYLDHLA